MTDVDTSVPFPVGLGPRIGAFDAGNTIVNYSTAIEIFASEIPALSIAYNNFGFDTGFLIGDSNGVAIRSQAPSSGGQIFRNSFLGS